MVKNQGHCGSCWSFSTTGLLEAYFQIYKSVDVLLSEQELVDCSDDYGNAGCRGGNDDPAIDYVIDHGLSTEEDYPYNAKYNKCKVPEGKKKIS